MLGYIKLRPWSCIDEDSTGNPWKRWMMMEHWKTFFDIYHDMEASSDNLLQLLLVKLE